MFRFLILIVIVMSSVAFAQTDENPQAVKIDEFERATNGYVKMKMDNFYVELNNNPTAQGYIINFGTAREIAIRERQIRNAINFRKFDASRITIVNGGFRGVVKTEFWIVPAGGENPKIDAAAKKIDEFGKATSGELKARLDFIYIELNNNPDYQGYIVNFGSTKDVIRREKEIKMYASFRKYDLSRLEFIRGGAGKTIKTEFWIDLLKPDESKNKK
jgi:hypothetical protein